MTQQATRPTKHAFLWLLFLGPFFFLVYGFCNWWTAQRLDVGIYVFDWEQHIPFIPWLIWPYMSIDLFFALSLFLCKSHSSLNTHAYRLIAAIVISAIGFLLFPLRFSFTIPSVDGLAALAFKALLSFDQPYNQAPSLHISLLMILWVKYAQVFNGVFRRTLDIWFFLIFISVVFVYQHHVIDVITGFIIGIICLYLFPQNGWRWTQNQQNRRLGKQYGVVSVILVMLASILKGGFWLLLWPATAFFIVALAYTGVGSGVFQKQASGKQTIFAQLLLLPFLVGAKRSAARYNKNLAPYTMITSNIAIGGIDAPKQQKWDAILDLTAEFNASDHDANYHCIPILDLTIPQPILIREALTWLSQQPSDARICIHCALGLSRSATMMAAWLVDTGQAKNAADAFLLISTYRPIVWRRTHELLIDQVCSARKTTV